jgi:hypothetical protein
MLRFGRFNFDSKKCTNFSRNCKLFQDETNRYPRALLEQAKHSNPCILGKKTADYHKQTAVF